jgi:hypothetical protein
MIFFNRCKDFVPTFFCTSETNFANSLRHVHSLARCFELRATFPRKDNQWLHLIHEYTYSVENKHIKAK